MAVEVLLEGAQPMVFDTDGLALHFTGTVAALVDQDAQGAAGANLREVADLAGLGHLQRPIQTCDRRHGQQQRQAQHKQRRGSDHPLSEKKTGQHLRE